MWINWISDATIWQLQKPVFGVWSCAGTRCCRSPFRLPHLLCEPSSIVLPVGIPVIRFQCLELTWRFDCVPEVCDDRSGCSTSKLGILHGWWDKEEKARGWAVEMLLIRGLEFASSFHIWVHCFIWLQHPGTGIAKCATPQPQHKCFSAPKMLKSCWLRVFCIYYELLIRSIWLNLKLDIRIIRFPFEDV